MTTNDIGNTNNGKRISLSLIDEEPITYNSIIAASRATGAEYCTLVGGYKKTDKIHPVIFKSRGKKYVLRREGLEDHFDVKLCIKPKISSEDRELIPINHKDFMKFIKGKRFEGYENYSWKEIKGMFGYKPAYSRRDKVRITIDDGEKETTYNSLGEAVKSSGLTWYMINCARKVIGNSESIKVNNNDKEYNLKFN